MFANEYFDFSNYQVNECVTAEGRRIHKQMESAAENEYDFQVVFGFTDSTFVKAKDSSSISVDNTKKVHDFIKYCKDELRVPVELKAIFVNSIFYAKKNRFVGWTGKEDEDPIIKGLDGLSDLNPSWVRRWFEKIVTELVKHPDTRFEVAPRMIRKAYDELDNSRIDFSKELKFTARVGKEVHEYKPGTGNRTRKLAELLGKERGDLVHWYETYEDIHVGTGQGKKHRFKRIKSYSIESEPENLNLDAYKELLLRKLRDSLEITGFDVAELKQESLQLLVHCPV